MASKPQAGAAWDAYAPQGSKRRQVLDFLGVGRASTSSGGKYAWFSAADKGTDSDKNSRPAVKPPQSTRDTTQSLANYFSPSRKNEMGPAAVRAQGVKLGSAAWEDESRQFRAEHKRSLWVTPAFYIPGSRGRNAQQSGENAAHVKSPDIAEDDGEEPEKKKGKIQFMGRRNARSAQTTMANVLKRKIFISADRAKTLKQIYEDVKAESVQQPVEDALAEVDLATVGTQPEPIRVLLLGFEKDDPQVEQFRASLGDGYLLRVEKFVDRDWVTMMKTARSTYTVDEETSNVNAFEAVEDSSSPVSPPPEGEEAADAVPESSKKKDKKKRQPQVVVVRCAEEEVTEFQTCTVSAHFMANRIVCPFIDAEHLPEEQQEQMHKTLEDLMQTTWPVHRSIESVCEFCKSKAPMLIRLNRRIRDEVHHKIHHYGKVNYLWHGAKRVPVAFVPFGVSAVNFLGLSKLVANILRDTGMFKDAETKKAGIAQAALSYGKVFVLDNLGDLYQITAAGTVVAGLSEALMAGGLLAAVETLGAVDFALLGSASFVTGAVAAVGAALSRPDMVESLASLIATLQTLWLVFPQIRRSDDDHPESKTDDTPADVKDKAGNHAKLYQMCSMLPERQAQDDVDMQTAPEAGPSTLQAGMYTEEVDDKEMQEALKLMLGEEEAALVLPDMQDGAANQQSSGTTEPVLCPR